jgi:hypothetical protein
MSFYEGRSRTADYSDIRAKTRLDAPTQVDFADTDLRPPSLLTIRGTHLVRIQNIDGDHPASHVWPGVVRVCGQPHTTSLR